MHSILHDSFCLIAIRSRPLHLLSLALGYRGVKKLVVNRGRLDHTINLKKDSPPLLAALFLRFLPHQDS